MLKETFCDIDLNSSIAGCNHGNTDVGETEDTPPQHTDDHDCTAE